MEQAPSNPLQELALPPRQPQPRARFNPLNKINVRTNCHRVTFTDMKFYRYEARFHVVNERGDKDLSSHIRESVNEENHRHLLKHLFDNFRGNHSELFDPAQSYIFDCSCTLISPVHIELPTEPIYEIDVNSLDQQYRDALPLRVVKLYVIMKFVGEIQLDSASLKKADEQDLRDRSPIQVLELLFNQHIITSNNFHVFPQKSFLKEAGQMGGAAFPTFQGRIIKDGVSKGLRLCGNDPTKPELMLQIDVRKGAFFPATTVIDYLKSFLGCRDDGDLMYRLRDMGNLRKVASDLTGLTLSTTHLQKNRIFRGDGIDDRSARERVFSFESDAGPIDAPSSKRIRRDVSVVDYYYEVYKFRLQFPDSPCVIERMRNSMINYYPMEILKILDSQRVSLQKMDDRFQENMIKTSCMDPPQFVVASRRLTTEAALTSDNPIAKAYGCQMESDPVHLQAEVLHPPALVFANRQTAQVTDARPNLQDNRKFLVNGRCRAWLAVVYRRCVDHQSAQLFFDHFVKFSRDRGTQLGNYRYLEAQSDREIYDTAKEHRAEFILFITGDRDGDELHSLMKFYEASTGVATQHIRERTVKKQARPQKVTMEHIVMKTNEKLGGTNFSIMTGQSFINANRQDRAAATYIEQHCVDGRLFIGIDTSNTCSKDAQTAFGVTYNYNESLSMNGFYFFMPPRTTIVQNLGPHIVRAIMDYKQRSQKKAWPSHIMIYRGGVSEGDYITVIDKEVGSIRQTMAEFCKQNNCPPIGFTMLTAQCQHKYRVIPAIDEQALGPSAPSGDQNGGFGGQSSPAFNNPRGGYQNQSPAFNNPHGGYQNQSPAFNNPRGGYQNQSPAFNNPRGGYQNQSPGFNARGGGGFQGRGGYQGQSPGFNRGGRPPKNDVPPGTYLFEQVIDPTKEQFILTPHKAFQGIPKPVVFTVIADESPRNQRVSRDELANLTYALCYVHGGVLAPVSLPTFLYHAGQVAKRGDANRQILLRNQPDCVNLSLEELANRLAPRSQFKFWC